ncbi:MAG: MerR family transcriptional regulator [Nocardia sp.]|nr:MerR family transcriptional regulator [Nocardia sp.]NUS91226.1 MerR family transcriptional regulator [Nocardia sp.]
MTCGSAKLSQRTSVSRRLLRNYEEQGLPTAHRSGGGFREYDPDAPAVVRHIRALLAAYLAATEVGGR